MDPGPPPTGFLSSRAAVAGPGAEAKREKKPVASQSAGGACEQGTLSGVSRGAGGPAGDSPACPPGKTARRS
jgi:hypothetical protein